MHTSGFIEQMLGSKSTWIDPNVYRIQARWNDGLQYYELLLVYVNDCLVISYTLDATMKKIGEEFNLLDGFAKPTTYLGAETEKFQVEGGRKVWRFKLEQCSPNC